MEEQPQKFLGRRLSSASDVIDALGGTNSVAEMLDIGASSVSNYRKQGFPARSHFILAKICAERGLDVADAVFGGYQLKAQAKPYQRATTSAPTTALNSGGNTALNRLEQDGFTRLSLPILQPAAPFIDRMGPEMQRRLFTFTDPGGEQLCLRPDLTIPTALAHIASGATGEARYCYQGTAFRYQPRGSGQPEEFTQLGLEIIGGESEKTDNNRVFESIVDVIKTAGLSLEKCEITLSDALHYSKRVDKYDISKPISLILKQRLGQGDRLEDIYRAIKKQSQMTSDFEVSPPADEIIIAGRSGMEIRKRLDEKKRRAEIAQADLVEFERFIQDAAKDIENLESGMSLHGGPSEIERDFFEQALILGVKGTDIFMRPAAGQKMAYYTGIFFEIRVKGIDRPIATGGRYDDLLQSLGAPKPLSAVGGAIALERLNRAIEMQ